MKNAILKAIKANNVKYENESFNKGIKLENLEPYNKPGYENFTVCYDGNTLTRFKATCIFKARKYENNVVFYQVNVYSNGAIEVYFDGTSYKEIKK